MYERFNVKQSRWGEADLVFDEDIQLSPYEVVDYLNRITKENEELKKEVKFLSQLLKPTENNDLELSRVSCGDCAHLKHDSFAGIWCGNHGNNRNYDCSKFEPKICDIDDAKNKLKEYHLEKEELLKKNQNLRKQLVQETTRCNTLECEQEDILKENKEVKELLYSIIAQLNIDIDMGYSAVITITKEDFHKLMEILEDEFI